MTGHIKELSVLYEGGILEWDMSELLFFNSKFPIFLMWKNHCGTTASHILVEFFLRSAEELIYLPLALCKDFSKQSTENQKLTLRLLGSFSRTW